MSTENPKFKLVKKVLRFSVIGGTLLSAVDSAMSQASVLELFASQPNPESTVCAQVEILVRNRQTGTIMTSNDSCFDRDLWEELPADFMSGFPYRNYITSVNKPSGKKPDIPVGPQPH